MRHLSRFALLLPLSLSLAACGAGPQSTETPDNAEPAFQETVPPGTQVTIARGGQWVPATIVKQTGATKARIHYDGMPAEWDEEVTFDRLRSRPNAAPAVAFKPGEILIVRSQNRLFVAEMVQQVDPQNIRVHYAGYGPEVAENVSLDRAARPFLGATAYPVGTAVLVNAGAPQPLPGKVVAVVAADQWIVRLDGAGPNYDQTVGADRIFPAAAPAPTAAPTVSTVPTAAPTTTPAASGSASAGKPPAAGSAQPATKPPAASPAAPAAQAPLQVGDAVLVHVRNVYYPAKITAAGSTSASWKVRLEGQSVEEEFAKDKVVRLQDPLKNVKYANNQNVFIEWHGVYAAGKVIKEMSAGNYKIRVDGASPDADEIVVVKRLRPR